MDESVKEQIAQDLPRDPRPHRQDRRRRDVSRPLRGRRRAHSPRRDVRRLPGLVHHQRQGHPPGAPHRRAEGARRRDDRRSHPRGRREARSHDGATDGRLPSASWRRRRAWPRVRRRSGRSRPCGSAWRWPDRARRDRPALFARRDGEVVERCPVLEHDADEVLAGAVDRAKVALGVLPVGLGALEPLRGVRRRGCARRTEKSAFSLVTASWKRRAERRRRT